MMGTSGSDNPGSGVNALLELLADPVRAKKTLDEFTQRQADALAAEQEARAAKADAEAKQSELRNAEADLAEATEKANDARAQREAELRAKIAAFNTQAEQRAGELDRRAEALSQQRKDLDAAKNAHAADVAAAKVDFDAKARELQAREAGIVQAETNLNQRIAGARQMADDAIALMADAQRKDRDAAVKLDAVRAFAETARAFADGIA